MKRLGVLLATFVAVLSVSAVAGASNGSGTPFKATYEGSPGATWTCSGARVVNKQGVKDSETCIVSGDTTGYAAGTYSGAPIGCWAGSPFGCNTGFLSDFDGQFATSWTVTEIDNGDGTFTMNMLATY